MGIREHTSDCSFVSLPCVSHCVLTLDHIVGIQRGAPAVFVTNLLSTMGHYLTLDLYYITHVHVLILWPNRYMYLQTPLLAV